MFLIFTIGRQFEFNLLCLYVLIFLVGELVAGLASGSGDMVSARPLKVYTGKMFANSIGAIAFAFYTLTHYLIYICAGSNPEISAFIANTFDMVQNSSLAIGKSHKTKIDNVGYTWYAFIVLEDKGFICGVVIVQNGVKGSSCVEGCKNNGNLKENFYCMPSIDIADLNPLAFA